MVSSFRDAPTGLGPESIAPLERPEEWILDAQLRVKVRAHARPGMTRWQGGKDVDAPVEPGHDECNATNSR